MTRAKLNKNLNIKNLNKNLNTVLKLKEGLSKYSSDCQKEEGRVLILANFKLDQKIKYNVPHYKLPISENKKS